MTNYEKFLKGAISEPVGFIFSEIGAVVVKVRFYSYRISKYEETYYLFVYTYGLDKQTLKAVNEAKDVYYKIIGSHNTTEKKETALAKYNATFVEHSCFVPVGELLLKTKSLNKLKLWLENKKTYIVGVRPWKIL